MAKMTNMHNMILQNGLKEKRAKSTSMHCSSHENAWKYHAMANWVKVEWQHGNLRRLQYILYTPDGTPVTGKQCYGHGLN